MNNSSLTHLSGWDQLRGLWAILCLFKLLNYGLILKYMVLVNYFYWYLNFKVEETYVLIVFILSFGWFDLSYRFEPSCSRVWTESCLSRKRSLWIDSIEFRVESSWTKFDSARLMHTQTYNNIHKKSAHLFISLLLRVYSQHSYL